MNGDSCMKKKLILFIAIFFIFLSNLNSGTKRIHLKGFVPETFQIKVDYKKEIILFNNLAYYIIKNEEGNISNFNNGYYLEVFMI